MQDERERCFAKWTCCAGKSTKKRKHHRNTLHLMPCVTIDAQLRFPVICDEQAAQKRTPQSETCSLDPRNGSCETSWRRLQANSTWHSLSRMDARPSASASFTGSEPVQAHMQLAPLEAPSQGNSHPKHRRPSDLRRNAMTSGDGKHDH